MPVQGSRALAGAVAALVAIVVGLLTAATASAAPPLCPPNCETWTETQTNTLTVEPPSHGTITGGAIACGAACTTRQTQSRDCITGDGCGGWWPTPAVVHLTFNPADGF